MLITHMASVHSFESFGAVVNVERVTLYNWAKEHPEFFYAKKQGQMKCQHGLENIGNLS